jgi:hypothetical protein
MLNPNSTGVLLLADIYQFLLQRRALRLAKDNKNKQSTINPEETALPDGEGAGIRYCHPGLWKNQQPGLYEIPGNCPGEVSASIPGNIRG